MVFYSSSLYSFPLATHPEPSPPLSASSSPPPSGDSGKLWLLCALIYSFFESTFQWPVYGRDTGGRTSKVGVVCGRI